MNILEEIDARLVADATARLTAGRFGNSKEILSRAQSFYGRVGLHEPAATVHPISEPRIEEAHHRGGSLRRSDICFLEAGIITDRRPTHDTTPTEQDDANCALAHVIAERLDSSVEPYRPNDDKLGSAVAALRSNSPRFADIVTDQVRVVLVCFDSTIVATSWTDMPGLVVLGKSTLRSVHGLSDSLLHEALHSTMSMIARGEGTSLHEGRSRLTIAVPWRSSRGDNNIWSIDRATDAYHVYSYLTALWAQRSVRPDAGNSMANRGDAVDRFLRVAFRAEFLRRQLRESNYDGIADFRRQMCAWLDTCAIPPIRLTATAQQILNRRAIAYR